MDVLVEQKMYEIADTLIRGSGHRSHTRGGLYMVGLCLRHSRSLISQIKQDKPGLHSIYGIPFTLNLSDYLFFHGLTLIAQSRVSDERKLELTKEYVRTLRT